MYIGPTISHFIVEVFDESHFDLNSVKYVSTVMNNIIVALKLHSLKTIYHKFELGITYIAILSESHSSIHTWPEYGYLHYELISCREINSKEISEVIDFVFNKKKYFLINVTPLLIEKQQIIRSGYPLPPKHLLKKRHLLDIIDER